MLGGSAVALFTLVPGIAAYLPLHGSPPALFNSDSFLAINDVLKTAGSENLTHANRGQVLLALSRSLTGTLVIMLPIT